MPGSHLFKMSKGRSYYIPIGGMTTRNDSYKGLVEYFEAEMGDVASSIMQTEEGRYVRNNTNLNKQLAKFKDA